MKRERRLERLDPAAQSISGRTRWILASASLDVGSEPGRRASRPSDTATASSSVSMSGGSRKPGRMR